MAPGPQCEQRTTGQRGRLILPSTQLTVTPWQKRVFLDVRKVWRLDERLNLSLSDRFNLRAQVTSSCPITKTLAGLAKTLRTPFPFSTSSLVRTRMLSEVLLNH